MASIQGITIKGIKTFMGREGPCHQGNLYLGNKKIGFWSEDFTGGPDEITLDKNYSVEKLTAIIKESCLEKAMTEKDITGKPYAINDRLECLIQSVVELLQREKMYKKRLKEGYPITVYVTDMFRVTCFGVRALFLTKENEDILHSLHPFIEKIKKNMFQDAEIQTSIIRSIDQFSVGEPIKLEDILN